MTQYMHMYTVNIYYSKHKTDTESDMKVPNIISS